MLMDWHVANKSEDGVMRGPANSKTWQIVEDRWPQFKEEPRHLTLGLAIDGVKPIFFTTIKIFSVANCGARLQLTTSFDNEQCIYVVCIYHTRKKASS